MDTTIDILNSVDSAWNALREGVKSWLPHVFASYIPKRETLKVYVAQKTKSTSEYEKLINEIQRAGFRIAHDEYLNTDIKRFYDSPLIYIDKQDQQTMGLFASQDISCLRNADVVVVLLDGTVYHDKGTWTELGIALALNKFVVVMPVDGSQDSHINRDMNMYYWHRNVIHVTSYDDILRTLKDIRLFRENTGQ